MKIKLTNIFATVTVLTVIVFYGLIFADGTSFAMYSPGEPHKPTDIKLLGKRINFTNSAFVLDKFVMVPAVAFLESIGTQVTHNSFNSELIAYKDNVFLKLKQNSRSAFVNGKEFNLPVPVILQSGVLYVDASFLLKIFGLDSTVTADGTLDVEFIETQPDTMILGYTVYRKFSFLDRGTSLFVPDYFELDADSFTNIHDTSRLKVETPVISDSSNLEDAVLLRKDELSEQGIQTSEPKTARLGEFISSAIEYTLENVKTTEYLFLENGNLYILTFSDTPTVIEETIAGTFYIDKITLNTNLEHYFEHPAFFEYQTNLKTKIFSNMIVKNNFALEGSFGSSINSGYIEVNVKRADRSVKYTSRIIDGSFESVIYTPFGLGRHEVAIRYLPADSESGKTLPIISFSALNESVQHLSDLIPTDTIDFDRNEIYNLMNTMGYYGANQYSVAKGVYSWILENYKLSESGHPDEPNEKSALVENPIRKIIAPRKMSVLALQLPKESMRVTAEEACILYIGFMRASGIPSRLGHTKEPELYWAEVMINGKWVMMGIAEDLKTGQPNNFYRRLPKKD